MKVLKIKRVYDEATKDDGFRILVDRLWPRGLKKENAKIDCWLKNVAPSTELRKWFDHDSEKWEEFRAKYNLELEQKVDAVKFLLEKLNDNDITLLYAAKNVQINHALILKDYLDKRIKNI